MNNLKESHTECIAVENIYNAMCYHLNIQRNQPKKFRLLNIILTAAIFAGQKSDQKMISYSRNSSSSYQTKSLILIIDFLSYEGLIINHKKGRGRNMLVHDVNTVNWFKATTELLSLFDDMSIYSVDSLSNDLTDFSTNEYSDNLYHLFDFENTKMVEH